MIFLKYQDLIENITVSAQNSSYLCIHEIMSLIIQHEWYREFLSEKWLGRDIELDAIDADQEEEKHYG